MVFPYLLAKRLQMLGFFSPGSGRNVTKKPLKVKGPPKKRGAAAFLRVQKQVG
jgi:hypothetical protein